VKKGTVQLRAEYLGSKHTRFQVELNRWQRNTEQCSGVGKVVQCVRLLAHYELLCVFYHGVA
jgi:hypothetical protein